MPHTEPAVNAALATILRPMFARATVAGEDTGSVVENPALQLDVLITAPGRSPVSIETEFLPARTVEEDALSRLGKTARRDAKTIEAAIAVRYPERLRNDDVDINDGLLESRFSYAVFTQEGPANNLRAVRSPESGWLEGDVGDLADLTRLLSVPQRAAAQAAENLQSGIDMAATVLGELDKTRGQINIDIAAVLGMDNVEQTRRMACAIVANAMVFHERIVGMHPDARIKTLDKIADTSTANPKGELLESWRQILYINYHPIFDIAHSIVDCLPTVEDTRRFIRILSQSGNYVSATGIDNAHDLTGRVFQRLISDRKYLATFYTRPASAALLAQLAVEKLQGVDWADTEAIGKLRIADFACGTGALLSAVYEQIASRHARAGRNPRDLHTVMMQEVLTGCDVMPSAVHITAATLAGIEPDVPYDKSRLYSMSYGRQDNGEVRIGSLEFLVANSVLTNTRDGGGARQVGSGGETELESVRAEVPDESLDLVIMNPPFTRAGSDWEGAERSEDYIKQFKGLSTTLDTQKEMSNRLKEFAHNTIYHGYAGIASAFVALADKKLKKGGIIALVLPISAAAGMSWQSFRRLLARSYTNLEVLSITSNGGGISFSADTNIAECLVIAEKNSTDSKAGPGRFASLERRPQDMMRASILAQAINEIDEPRSIDDGPYGGTPIVVGDQPGGELMSLPVSQEGSVWGTVRLLDGSVSQTAHALSKSALWLPATESAVELPVVHLSVVAQRGWHDINLAGSSGPFLRFPPRPTATYAALWSHNASKETRLLCEIDTELRVKRGLEGRAAEAWETRSRCYVNRDFRFNSQPLAAAFTLVRSIGGRAWPNVLFNDPRFDYAFSVWMNSTLGLLLFWWHSNRQQGGRGTTSISAIDSLPILDFRALTDDQLATAERIFEEFRDKELLPAYLADADPNRDLLDRRVIMDLLGFDEDTYLAVRRLAQKWCAEPSVHGGKARPRDARPIPGAG